MSILYYPDSIVKQKTHVVEKLQKPDILYSFRGQQDLNATPLSVVCWSPRSWEIKTVCVNFSTTTARDYGVYVAMMSGIVKGKNDTLWFKPLQADPQLITIPQGVYNGTTLAAALKDQLDANAAFVAQGAIPFTVSYATATGLFTIAAAAGKTFNYLENNIQVPVMHSRSPAGHDFGFTADSAVLNSIVSDTPVMGLGAQTMYFGGTASADINVVATDAVSMTSDNALVISSATCAGTIMSYEVIYKLLDA